MKHILTFLIMGSLLMLACGQNNANTATSPDEKGKRLVAYEENGIIYRGAKIDDKGVVPIKQIAQKMGQKEDMPLKIEGEVETVCQVKGCWMSLKKDDGSSMRVTFKDYEFFMPKDIAGKKVIVDGRAYLETTSVADLRHYAEDEGLPKSEIDKITESETGIAFEATGVMIKK